MNNSIYNQLTANLELLKLSQMKLHLDEIRDFVTNNGLSFTEGLLKLSNYEVDFKEQSASRSMIKAAAFPFVKELKDMGALFQSNYGSIIGMYGSSAKKTVKKLLKENCISFLGSDVHKTGQIYSQIPKILKKLNKWIPSDMTQNLTTLNAQKVLENQGI